MKLSVDLRLVQKLVMTPQLQQAIKLLQLSKLELSQTISQELLENPLLEEISQEQLEEEASVEGQEPEKESDEKDESGLDTTAEELNSQWEEYLEDTDYRAKNLETIENDVREGPSFEATLSKPVTLAEHLVSQLRLSKTSRKELDTGLYIIGNIDEDGYLRLPIEEIAEATSNPPEAVDAVLELIQTFDPTGVGARDLKECLLIQIKDRGIRVPFLKQIISDHLKDIENKKVTMVAKAINASLEEVIEAVKAMESLEPKPGRPFYSEEAQTIIPDVYVTKSEGQFRIVLNDDGLPRLHISPYYRKLITSKIETSSSTKSYLNEHLKSAVWLIRSIEQRNRTIFKVAQSIVNLQREFFERGISHLRPLVLRQVAEDISMHESTISRVTTNKYMHTSHGIFELKFFFNNSVGGANGDEGELSSVTVRDIIRQLVEAEEADKPLKDQEIMDRLMKKDIKIARRTVAKYRTELKIPSASRRKRYS